MAPDVPHTVGEQPREAAPQLGPLELEAPLRELIDDEEHDQACVRVLRFGHDWRAPSRGRARREHEEPWSRLHWSRTIARFTKMTPVMRLPRMALDLAQVPRMARVLLY